eukprot:2074847-Rhodomonas_salina.2
MCIRDRSCSAVDAHQLQRPVQHWQNHRRTTLLVQFVRRLELNCGGVGGVEQQGAVPVRGNGGRKPLL